MTENKQPKADRPETVVEEELPEVEATDKVDVGLLQKRLEEAETKRDDYLATAQRVQAEYDNFRRRNASVRQDALDDGTRNAVEAMLPVLDNLERAMDAAKDDQTPLAEGVAMVLRQFREALAGLGLEEIPALGEAFDPNVHNAVMQAEATEEYAAGVVCEVFQKGYRVRGRVLRASMVKVAQ
jgi:molecular chaperone GrpE